MQRSNRRFDNKYGISDEQETATWSAPERMNRHVRLEHARRANWLIKCLGRISLKDTENGFLSIRSMNKLNKKDMRLSPLTLMRHSLLSQAIPPAVLPMGTDGRVLELNTSNL